MAKPTTFKFGEVLIEVETTPGSGVYTAPCGLTSKNFNGSADTSDTTVPDCDDPDAPAWKERAVTALSRDISGDGVLADEFLQKWDDWFSGGDTRNVRITIGDFAWTGAYLLSTFNVTGTLGEKWKVSASMQSDGQIVRAAA